MILPRFPPPFLTPCHQEGGHQQPPGGLSPLHVLPSVGPARPGLQNGAGSLLLAAAPRLSHNRDL